MDKYSDSLKYFTKTIHVTFFRWHKILNARSSGHGILKFNIFSGLQYVHTLHMYYILLKCICLKLIKIWAMYQIFTIYIWSAKSNDFVLEKFQLTPKSQVSKKAFHSR